MSDHFPIPLVLAAASLMAFSGLPGCFAARRSRAAQAFSTVLMLLGALLGLAGVALSCLAESTPALQCAWRLPWGQFRVELDSLSAFFLVPVFVVPALGALYGTEYWKPARHPATARGLRFFYGLLAGSMAMVVLARDSVLFLVAWEIMAVSAFFLVATDDKELAVRRAAWIYLVAAHVGTVCLMALFCLLYRATGSTNLDPILSASLTPSIANAIFALAVVGFGFKAGIMPLHVWLPAAHANAPSHVSAVMSGVMLKMGIYGMVRIIAFLPDPAIEWGTSLLAVGAATGILGIAFALGQSDVKRLLAYSSIENVGIIVLGIGLALVGRTAQRPEIVALGMGGALFHVWNHSLFKSLLFLNSGSLIHAVHTRQMDQMGGLSKRMPRTAALFFVGAAAICGLPPLNGFAGEWLTYLGFFRAIAPASAPVALATGLGALALAMIGALAIACFVKLYGTVFMGSPRTAKGAHAHDTGPWMLAPSALLAAACIALGLFPQLALPAIGKAVAAWSPASAKAALHMAELAPTGFLTAAGLVLLAAALLAVLFLLRRPAIRTEGTWGCGYMRPTPRIQYTGSSFAQSLVGFFSWALLPNHTAPALRTTLFPSSSAMAQTVPDAVLDRAVMPFFRLTRRFLPWVRLLQQGKIHVYLLYILVVVLALLFWNNVGIPS